MKELEGKVAIVTGAKVVVSDETLASRANRACRDRSAHPMRPCVSRGVPHTRRGTSDAPASSGARTHLRAKRGRS